MPRVPKKTEERLAGLGKRGQAKSRGPVWAGPESDADNGGITFSLLSRFLCCKERFRLLVVEGLKPDEGFNHRIEYGQMWHVCEEAFASPSPECWEDALKEYVQGLLKKYPISQDDVLKWYNVCRTQFPIYTDYWSRHQDVTERTPLLQEQIFKVPYSLPSGRVVYLRGKWDSVDLLGKGKLGGVYLKENKTKGDIVEQQLRRQLNFDLQTMMYLVALNEEQARLDDSTIKARTGYRGLEDGTPNSHGVFRHRYPVCGVVYNVVRRPLSGGKGNIRPHQATKNKAAETLEDYYRRLAEVIREDPGHFFMRWRVEVSAHDVVRFRRECLDPVLEQLCWWWDETLIGMDISPVTGKRFSGIYVADRYPPPPLHFRMPFGVWNPLLEGASSELDEYLATGSEAGLRRTTDLFPELSGG